MLLITVPKLTMEMYFRALRELIRGVRCDWTPLSATQERRLNEGLLVLWAKSTDTGRHGLRHSMSQF